MKNRKLLYVRESILDTYSWYARNWSWPAEKQEGVLELARELGQQELVQGRSGRGKRPIRRVRAEFMRRMCSVCSLGAIVGTIYLTCLGGSLPGWNLDRWYGQDAKLRCSDRVGLWLCTGWVSLAILPTKRWIFVGILMKNQKENFNAFNPQRTKDQGLF
jgi:hypothetical protein